MAGCSAIAVVADQGLHGGQNFARDEDQVEVENAQDLQERVVAGNDLPGFDAGDMPLRKARLLGQLQLAPILRLALRPHLLPEVVRQTL